MQNGTNCHKLCFSVDSFSLPAFCAWAGTDSSIAACPGHQIRLQAPAGSAAPRLARCTFGRQCDLPRSRPLLPGDFLELEGAKPVIMQKDDLGVWSVTTAPLQPDYYGYIFRNADIPLIAPSNPLLLPNLVQTETMVHVSGSASLPWEISDGPHGVVHHHFYKSGIIGDQRDFYVCTPPGYDPHSKSKYPALYLLHGYGQKSSSWTEVGFANVILDHPIDEGKAKPMIVVMPIGYGGIGHPHRRRQCILE